MTSWKRLGPPNWCLVRLCASKLGSWSTLGLQVRVPGRLWGLQVGVLQRLCASQEVPKGSPRLPKGSPTAPQELSKGSGGPKKAFQRLPNSTKAPQRANMLKPWFYQGKTMVFQPPGRLGEPSEGLRKAYGPPSSALRPALDRQVGAMDRFGPPSSAPKRACRASKNAFKFQAR